MEPAALEPPLRPPDLVPALAQATFAITAISVVSAALGGAALLAVPIAASALYAGAQVTALTVPPLLLLQAMAALDTTPEATARTLLKGVEQGASLMVALAPLVLFLGMSSPGIFVATLACFGAIAVGLITTVTVSALRLGEADASRPIATRAVAWSWAFTAMIVAYPSVILAYDEALALCMRPLFGVGA